MSGFWKHLFLKYVPIVWLVWSCYCWRCGYLWIQAFLGSPREVWMNYLSPAHVDWHWRFAWTDMINLPVQICFICKHFYCMCKFRLKDYTTDIWFLDAIAYPSTYPCQSVGQWVIVSDLEIAIASPSFASLLYINRLKCLNAPILSALHLRCW